MSREDQPPSSPAVEPAGAGGGSEAELAAYLGDGFDTTVLDRQLTLPLPDEAFVPCWQGWAEEAREGGAFAVLAAHLPQLAFPVREGISESEPYRAAVRRGVPVETIPEASGLGLARPEALELALHPSPAGRVPVLLTREREDFVALARALAHRNEPRPIPDSQGALMLAGYNNWERIRELRQKGQSLAQVRDHKELYQDRLILLSDGPYSGVGAGELGLGEGEWRELSLAIRREHECAHYLTRRLFGAMRNHLLDELMADYAGLVAAAGRFPAAWFLRFLGLEESGLYRPGGRLAIYRGRPPLGDLAFRDLQDLARLAAARLESFDGSFFEHRERSPRERTVVVLALARIGLGSLTAPGGEVRLEESVRELDRRLLWEAAPARR